ncbi:hypothetical protein [Bradyrhizobium japonicum]|uniref:hypothetical protein n=1 Tax=Bradyrhizobium japonicum TaxID=375 RepID=UPI001BAD6D27|nr:hypothetical protein [Bradyrhizobium japonicum]MBR0911491.1 hypothetical protein [Bradyrhizobium japonicum]
MSLLLQDLLMVALAIAAAMCFRASQRYRGAVDRALEADRSSALTVPERVPFYGAAYIDAFRKKAATAATEMGRSALSVYLRPVLLWLDIGFAVTLSSASALFWKLLPALAPSLPYLGEISAFCMAMSIAYGVADVAEDLWLAKLLSKESPTGPIEGFVACSLTLLKFGTIGLSLVGGLAFVSFSKLFRRPAGS